MKRPPALLVIALTCFAAVAGLIACSSSAEPPAVESNTTAVQVGSSRVVTSCDQFGNRVYLTSSGLAVVGQDPTCKGATS